MSNAAVFLYVMGALLAIQYAHELDGGLNFGTLLMVAFWPILVPAIWVSAIIKTLIQAVRP